MFARVLKWAGLLVVGERRGQVEGGTNRFEPVSTLQLTCCASCFTYTLSRLRSTLSNRLARGTQSRQGARLSGRSRRNAAVSRLWHPGG